MVYIIYYTWTGWIWYPYSMAYVCLIWTPNTDGLTVCSISCFASASSISNFLMNCKQLTTTITRKQLPSEDKSRIKNKLFGKISYPTAQFFTVQVIITSSIVCGTHGRATEILAYWTFILLKIIQHRYFTGTACFLLVPELSRSQNDDPLALVCSPWKYSFSIAAEELQPWSMEGIIINFKVAAVPFFAQRGNVATSKHFKAKYSAVQPYV